MQKFLFILFFLINFLLINSQACTKSKKKASLVFYYNPESSVGMIRMPATVYIVPKDEADTIYVLTGNQTSKTVLHIFNIRCIETKSNVDHCHQYFQSSSIILEHLNDIGCAMKFDEKQSEIKTFLPYLSLNPYSKMLNLICIIERIYDDTSNSFDQNSMSGSSLFNLIFLCVCISITCGLFIGWFGVLYYRRCKRNRIKRQEQKELELSVKKILDKSPVIIFNSNNEGHDFIDDDPTCAICLESFVNNEELRKLICSHYFHITCVDPWLLSHQTCPLCNQNILNDFIPSISARITSADAEQNNRETQPTNIPPIVVNHNSIIINDN